MIGIIVLILTVISLTIATIVYNKQIRLGRNPWAWTIASFLIAAVSGVVLVIAGIAAIILAFGFER